MESRPLEAHILTDFVKPTQQSNSHKFVDFSLPLEVVLLESVCVLFG